MRRNNWTNFLLTIIAVALIVIAIRPNIAPHAVRAQSSPPYPFYFEPGTQMLRAPDGSKQIYGRESWSTCEQEKSGASPLTRQIPIP
jgi:hypothetical protein